MSNKESSPDNLGSERFFKRLKNEMFYVRSGDNVTIESFIEKLDSYIKWYNTMRIKISLGGMSPLNYEHSLGLVA